MRYLHAIAVGIAFAYVANLAVYGDAASVQLIAVFTLASIFAWTLTLTEPRWAAYVKWIWVALSFVVIYGIVTGPLDYLRLSSIG